MSDRTKDWLRQAERDLEQARDSRTARRHEWACFACHQAAKKSLKALHLHSGQEAWGHVVARLMRELPPSAALPPAMIDKGHTLDAFCVSARYANGHAEGVPFEHYVPLQSEEALRYAHEIVDLVRAQVA